MTTMPVYFMISYYVDWILEHFCTSFSDTATVDEATGTQHVILQNQSDQSSSLPHIIINKIGNFK